MTAQARKFAIRTHTVFGTAVFYIFSSAAILLLFTFGKNLQGAVFFIGLILLTAAVVSLKMITKVARPDDRLVDPHGHAFPSGHSAASAFLVLMAPYIASVSGSYSLVFSVGCAFGLLSLLIMWSRLALRVHTPLQVAAGAGIGILASVLPILFQGIIVSWLML